jgi:hypothetical protein
VYHATMSKPHNHVAILQMVQFSRGGDPRWCVFVRWGRLEETGHRWGDAHETRVNEHTSKARAIEQFGKHYSALTGNQWEEREAGTPRKQANKYRVVDTDTGANAMDMIMTSDDSYERTHAAAATAQLALDDRLKEVAVDMFDVGLVYRRLEEAGLDLSRLPLCRLTRKHVEQANAALSALRLVLGNIGQRSKLTDEEQVEVVRASHQFYSAVPYMEESDISTVALVDQLADVVRGLVFGHNTASALRKCATELS